MEKDITITKRYCDVCFLVGKEEEVASHQCLVCKQDICEAHTIQFEIRGGVLHPGFSGYLCPGCGEHFEGFLHFMGGVQGFFEGIGYNPEYNEERREALLRLIDSVREAIRRGVKT